MIINQKLGYNYTPLNGYKSEFIDKYKYIHPERNKLLLKSSYNDNNNNDYKTTYNSINLGDRSIIIKKICLSNIGGNTNLNVRDHPISLSLTEKEAFEDSNYRIIEKERLKLFNYRIKKIKMIIKIQSFIRRFLITKKYNKELQNIKINLSWTKNFVYKKKKLFYKNTEINHNYSYCDKMIKTNLNKNNFFTKIIIFNALNDKKRISKIQKFWRKKKYNLQLANQSRISNYQCQSEIINKYNYSKKINLMKNPKYNSMFNSLKYLKDESNSSNSKDKNKKDMIILMKDKEIFNKLYLKNKYIKRPQYIKLYNRNNKTSIKDDYINHDNIDKENDVDIEEDIYHYEVNDINKSFKDKSFTLFHDKVKNGHYIQQIRSNAENKHNIILDNKNKGNNNSSNNTDEIIIKNKDLKIWQKSKINFSHYMENMIKYKNLKPNKNFISINSSKLEKVLIIERKKDLINKPKISVLKKVKNNSKKNILYYNMISKFFINDEGIEPKISIERKLIMRKPNNKNLK